jgi:hypothetical protein
MSPSVSPQKLVEALDSLEARSLIEKRDTLFSLPPVIMEYVTNQLIENKIPKTLLKVFSSDKYQINNPHPQLPQYRFSSLRLAQKL